MGLIERFRAVRVHKARASWAPVVPLQTPELREAYKIADENVPAFERAFLTAVRTLLTPEIERDFKRAWNTRSLVEVMDSIPFYQEGVTDDLPVWERLVGKLEAAYANVVREAGRDAARAMNRDFGTDVKFELDDPDQITKAGEPGGEGSSPPPPVVPFVPVVPVNRYATQWIHDRALALVQQGITEQQREVVRDKIETAFAAGERAENTYKDIRDNIGLTDRESGAVVNRRLLHEAAGLPPAQVDRLVDKYRRSLLLKRAARIARTETIAAQAAGRRAVWDEASSAGLLPQVEREWMASPDCCPICSSLDGSTAPLGEPYQSDRGTFEIPAHPHCRCTETLRREGVEGRPRPPMKPRRSPTPRKVKPRPAVRMPVPPKATSISARPSRAPRIPDLPAPRVVAVPNKKPKAMPVSRAPALAVSAPTPPTRTPGPPEQRRGRPLPAKPERREVMTAPRTGKQIELTVRQQRADQNTRWVGTSLKRFEAANTNERRDVLQWSWIHGSKRKNAVRMKLAAAKEFGATGMVFNPRGFGVAGEDLAVMRREMRSIYVETQRELRAKGVKSVHLFRGVGPNAVPNSIESWTTDVSVAEDFARRQGPEGRVLEENFRSANVLNYRGSSNWTDGIHGDQSEFIIIRDD